jgi:hypothetical protein
VSGLRCCGSGVCAYLEARGFRSVDLEPGRPVCHCQSRGRGAFTINSYVSEAAPWAAQVRDLIEQFEQGTPQFRLDLWRALFGTQSFQSFFHPHKERSWCYPLVSSLDVVVDRAMSKSYIAVQPEDTRATIKADIVEIVNRGDGKQWIDEDKGLFEYPYRTLVVVFERK